MVRNNLRIRILLQTKIQECIASGNAPAEAFQRLRRELTNHDQIDWETLEFDEEACVIYTKSERGATRGLR